MSDQPTPTPSKVNPAAAKVEQQWACDSPLMSCRFDPLGRYVFATAEDHTILRWDAATGARVTYPGQGSWVKGLAFTPDGSTMLAADYAGGLTWWPVVGDQPQPIRRVEAHTSWNRTVAVSPDGSIIATGGNDQSVRLWKTADGTMIREITGHQSQVYTVLFDPTAASVVSGDLLGNVFQWDVATGKPVKLFDASRLYIYSPEFRAHYGGARSMAFSPDGKELACGGLHECTNAFAGENKPLTLVFDYATGELKRAHTADLKGVTWDLDYHPDGFLIGATGGQGGGALLFWAPDKEPESHRFALPNTARGMDLHPGGRRVATTHYDRHLRVTVIS